MPAVRINVKTTQKAAILNKAKTKAAGQRMVIAINDAIAQEGVRRVQSRLDVVLQNPTGYYRSRIQVDRRSQYRGISDGGVVYGGWLEGVDSRNKTTRFKGYRTFRIIRQELNKDKERLAAPAVNQFVKEMSR